MKIVNVVGARPNFVKIAPLMREMRRHPSLEARLVHAGQHYDREMSAGFFRDLSIPEPDADLGVGSGSHAFQTAETMKRLEPLLERWRPDVVLVVGDVNATLAAAITAAKLQVPVAHVEAGLRSFDRSMPEETNRILTDQVATWLFTTEASATENLKREGIAGERIHFVGNVMIDSLVEALEKAAASPILENLGLRPRGFDVLTLHRPSNVDDPATLSAILDAIAEAGRGAPIVFPAHPRTRSRLEALPRIPDSLHIVEPLPYLDFLKLYSNAEVVLTDSGGLQEETTFLGIPCLTLRNSTERPVTIEIGTNRLVRPGRDDLREAFHAARERRPAAPRVPPLWDGHAAERIVRVLAS